MVSRSVVAAVTRRAVERVAARVSPRARTEVRPWSPSSLRPRLTARQIPSREEARPVVLDTSNNTGLTNSWAFRKENK